MTTTRFFTVLVSAFFVSLSCEDIGNLQETALPPDQELIWVGKVFSGGRQCTQDVYVPPDTKRLLNAAGIAVFATSIELYAVCKACIVCPTYAAMHSARIRKSQLAQVEALGFGRIVDPAIYGKWNWLKSVGGITGHTLTPPPIVRIEYERSGLFSYYRNDTLVSTTTFIIRCEPTFLSADSSDVIHYQDSLRFVPQAFRIDNDTLKLTDLCIDCYGHAYRRIP